MSFAKKVRVMILLALALVLPFAVFEVYVVTVYGFAEPYSYFFSVPLAVVSFLLVQFVVGYAVVKGWTICYMPGNYMLLLAWFISLLVLFFLPRIDSRGVL